MWAGDGVHVGEGSTVSGCTASNNDDAGIHTGQGSTVSNCASFGNTNGIRAVGFGVLVTGCTFHSNTDEGISTQSGSDSRVGVSNSVFHNNTMNNFRTPRVAEIGTNLCDGDTTCP